MDYQTYLVGGAVRDELLGLPNSDRDWVVVGATAQQLLDEGFVSVGEDFPCFLHPDSKDEYALARTERKLGIEDNKVSEDKYISQFGLDVTLEQDLACRDLTMNAMAKTVDGEFIDPFDGRADIENRLLRHVSGAFREDPIRILRVARFAARYSELGFTVDSSTQTLMSKMVAAGDLDQLTPERVWKEVSRALATPKPSIFFEVLRGCGALRALMPEVEQLFGVPQTEVHHPEIDTGIHVMMVVDMAKRLFDDPVVTWAALMHDLGKGVTPKNEWPRHIAHESLGLPLIKNVSERFKVPKDFAEMALLVSEHHLRCHRIEEAKPSTVLRLIESLDGIRRPDRVQRFVQACEADARGRLGKEDEAYAQAKLLLHSLDVAKEIDIKPLLEKGYQGVQLADQIRQLRVSAIRNFRGDNRVIKG